MTCVSIRCRNTGVSNWISVPSSGRSVVVVLPRLSKVHRTTPFSMFIALISPRMGHHEFKQLLFRLPLFKRGSILAEHEKVRGMQSLGRATGWPLVVQFQLVRLIKKLQNLSIILHCVDSPQFNGVAFKLDAHTHFAARVRSADVEKTYFIKKTP